MNGVSFSVCLSSLGCLISFVLLANVKVRAGHDDGDNRRSRQPGRRPAFASIPSRCISSARIVRRWGMGSYLVKQPSAAATIVILVLGPAPGHNPLGLGVRTSSRWGREGQCQEFPGWRCGCSRLQASSRQI